MSDLMGIPEFERFFRQAASKLGQNVDVDPFLERMATWPQLDLALSEDVRDELPNVAGGLGVALPKSCKILDAELKNPSTEHWDRAFGLFGLLL